MNRHFEEMKISKGQEKRKTDFKRSILYSCALQTFATQLWLKYDEKIVSKKSAKTLGRNG